MEPPRTVNDSDMDDQLDFEADEVPLSNCTDISSHVSPVNRELAADQVMDDSTISISSEWQPLIDLIQPTVNSTDAEENASQSKQKMVQIIGDLIKSNEVGLLDVDALNQFFVLIGYPLDNENNNLNDVYSNGINVNELMQHVGALQHEKNKLLYKSNNQNGENVEPQLDLTKIDSELAQPIVAEVLEIPLGSATEKLIINLESKEGASSKPHTPTMSIVAAAPNASIFDALPEANLDTPLLNVSPQCVPAKELLPAFSPVSVGNPKSDELPVKSVTSVKTNAHPKALSPTKRAPLRRKNANSKIIFKKNAKENILQNKYILLDKIGRGTYGKVYKGQNYFTNEIVAVKRIYTQCKPEALETQKKFMARERDNLLELVNCSTIIRLLDAYDVNIDGKIIKMDLMFEYCEYDLGKVLKSFTTIRIDEVKCFMRQILHGLFYMHEKMIVHRDLKTENILLTGGGVVKIGDFGLSRKMHSAHDTEPMQNYSNRVVTLWYRAPELLFGDINYTDRIDLWSLGCIMAEFWTRAPIIRGDSEIEQLKYISQLGGSFNPNDWPRIVNLRLYNTFELPGPYLRRTLTFLQHGMLNDEANYFFDKLLMYDPDKRHSAWTALNDAFFFSDPLPSRDLTGFMRRNKALVLPQAIDSTENQENQQNLTQKITTLNNDNE